MKKILLILTVIMLMTTQAFADQSGKCGKNATWTLNETTGVLTISGTGNMTDYNSPIESPFYSIRFSIKQAIIQEGITSIGNYAFFNCSGLISINIPHSVTRIGNNAFSYCSGLTSINIPNSVTSIGSWAFYGCSGLTSINIPNSVTSIEYRAFKDCSGLTSINIPNSVTRIEEYTFSGCRGLTEINIPNSVTYIGQRAFEDCRGLTSISIPNSVTRIGYFAFYGCYLQKSNVTNNSAEELTGIIYIDERTQDGLCIKGGVVVNCSPTSTTVNVPNSVTSIESDAFSGCSGLTSINIPNSVTSIGYAAFSGCSGLKSINIPNSVTEIGGYAFSDCSGLTSINIPNSVTSIGNYAFRECSGLTSIKVETGNTKYDSRDNCNAIIETETNALILGCENTIIPNSVTSIGHYAFSGCGGLTEINIPNSVTSIGDYAFSRCGALKIVYMSSAQPPTCSSYTFDGVDKNTCTLYVPEKPATALLKYCGTAPWNTFVNIETFNPEGSEEDTLKKKLDVNDDGVVNSTDIVRLYNYIITGK